MISQKLLETVADFSYLLGRSGYFSGDSRADIQEVIYWAEDFEKRNKNTDWSEVDYITEIERFTYSKIKELRSMYNCK